MNDDLEVAHPQSGSSPTLFLVELDLEMLVFVERGKPEYPEKNVSEQRRERTKNSTYIWRRLRDLNLGHIQWKASALTSAPSLATDCLVIGQYAPSLARTELNGSFFLTAGKKNSQKFLCKKLKKLKIS